MADFEPESTIGRELVDRLPGFAVARVPRVGSPAEPGGACPVFDRFWRDDGTLSKADFPYDSGAIFMSVRKASR